MVAPHLGILAIHTEDRNFILDLDHENGVGLRINLHDVLHESAEGSDFAADNRLIIVGCGVVVDNAISVHRARICLLIADNVHGRVQLAGQIAVDSAVPAGVVPEPVQHNF